MYLLIKKASRFLIILYILSLTAIATDDMDIADSSDEESQNLTQWERNLRKAAESYGIPYEDFKNEALVFLASYKEKNPTSNVGLEDLIVIKKPDPRILESTVALYREKNPGTNQEEIDAFIALSQPSRKFLVPSG